MKYERKDKMYWIYYINDKWDFRSFYDSRESYRRENLR